MNEARYRKWLILLLLCGLVFTNFDRQVLALAMQPIKAELSLSDTQLGFLTGIAFALFYSFLGFPLARLADRGDRVLVIAATTALCSLAIALCGAARSFVQLLLIRVGVAIGETGFIPAANSLIAEYFDRSERARALSIYLLGGPLSIVLGYFMGGRLIEHYGWRTTFVLMGSPGLALAVLTWAGLREPRRVHRIRARAEAGRAGREAQTLASQAGIYDSLKSLLSRQTFRQLLYSYAILSFFDYGRSQWLPAFYIRSFGLDTASVGTWMAVIYGLSGLVGMGLGGWLATRYAPDREALQLKVMAGIFICNALMSVGVCLASTRHLAFTLSALSTALGAMTGAPFFAILQGLVPQRMRAQATAFIFLVASLIGMGLGPLAAGMLSDVLHARFGEESLRYTLLVLSPGFLWCAWHTWRGGNTVAADLARTDLEAQGEAERAASGHGLGRLVAIEVAKS